MLKRECHWARGMERNNGFAELYGMDLHGVVEFAMEGARQGGLEPMPELKFESVGEEGLPLPWLIS